MLWQMSLFNNLSGRSDFAGIGSKISRPTSTRWMVCTRFAMIGGWMNFCCCPDSPGWLDRRCGNESSSDAGLPTVIWFPMITRCATSIGGTNTSWKHKSIAPQITVQKKVTYPAPPPSSSHKLSLRKIALVRLLCCLHPNFVSQRWL